MFRVAGELKSFETAFYRRHLLPLEEKFSGPAVLLQKDSTTIVPPHWSAVNDRAGNLILNVDGAA
jgi:N-methylhydantoinase A